MITEDYVSFEIAKLLDKKGFNMETDMYYNTEGILKIWMPNGNKSWLSNDGIKTHWCDCIAPTIQSAMKWLRDVYHLIILIRTGRKSEESSGHRFWFSIEDDDMKELADRKHQYDYCADTYERACEDAIKYCLTNLI